MVLMRLKNVISHYLDKIYELTMNEAQNDVFLFTFHNINLKFEAN